MGGIGENVATIGDWALPCPSPRSFFSSILSDGISSTSTWEPSKDDTTQDIFMGSRCGTTVPDISMEEGRLLASVSEQNSIQGGALVERMAARAGFNAPRLVTQCIRPDLFLNPEVHSPYLTIPPGLSPMSLLDSPVFLASSLGQSSPTTGKSFLAPNFSDKNSRAVDIDRTSFSFSFKPVSESATSFSGATLQQQSFSNIEVSVLSENLFQTHEVEPTKVQSQEGNALDHPEGIIEAVASKDDNRNIVTTGRTASADFDNQLERCLPHEQHEDEADETVYDGGTLSEDGYNWRKYGQKQVKGSEYPRSYYKCSHADCRVKKKVERSHEGYITEIIYKGAHNHSKPLPNPRAPNTLTDLPEQAGLQTGAGSYPIWAIMDKENAENVEVISSVSRLGNPPSFIQPQKNSRSESGNPLDASSTFSNDEDEDLPTHGSVVYDGDGDESEPKRRKLEAHTATQTGEASRGIQEPRVVVQTTSEVDILDDGYRWRKYGQKVVKGNPNPRSYYKCTNAGCTVRKHVERASHDLKSVITTYEGKHNHDVPATRNPNQVNPGTSGSVPSQAVASQNHIFKAEPPHVPNMTTGFNVSAAPFGSFRPQLSPPSSFSFTVNEQGLTNLAMTGLGPEAPKLPIHPYLTPQHLQSEMGLKLPKASPIPKLEPISDAGLGMSGSSSLYQQIMSMPPLGPRT